MAFEEQLPQWENEGTQPPQSKRVEGWLPNEKPPASWFNWLFHRAYKALQELQQKAVEREEFESHASRHAAGGPDAITPSMIGAAPISHGFEHNHDGSDPIPDLVQLRDDLNTHLDEKAPHPDAEILQSSEEIRVTSTDDATSAVDAPLKSAGGLAVAKSAYVGDGVRHSTSDALISSLSKAVRPGEVLEQGKKHVFHVKINPVNTVFLDIKAVYRENLSTHHHSIHEEMAFYFNGAVVQRLQREKIADLASSTDIVKIEISDVTFVDANTVKLEIANIGERDLSDSSYVAINGFGGVYDFVYVGKEDL